MEVFPFPAALQARHNSLEEATAKRIPCIRSQAQALACGAAIHLLPCCFLVQGLTGGLLDAKQHFNLLFSSIEIVYQVLE